MRRIIGIFTLLLFLIPTISLADGETKSNAVVTVGANITSVSAPAPATVTIFPVSIPLLQGGKIGDVTAMMPKFDHPALTPLQHDVWKDGALFSPGDIVKKVLDVYYGYWCSRITYDELESYLLKKAEKYDGENIRYSVKYKDAVHALSVGGGGGGLNAGADGLTSGTGVGIAGGAWSVQDPYFIITFYEIK